jgi:predicted ester cyclase
MYLHKRFAAFSVIALIASIAPVIVFEQVAQGLGGGLPVCPDGKLPPCKKGGTLRGKVSSTNLTGSTIMGADNMTSCSEGKIIGASKMTGTSNMTTGTNNDTGTTERNKEIVRTFVEQVLNLHNLTAIDQHVAPNFVGYEKNGVIDREGLRQFFSDLISGFPNIHSIIESIIAEGNKVVVFLNISGTQNGQYYNMAPTGKQLSTRVAALVGLGDDGSIAEHCTVEDSINWLDGLGIISFNRPTNSSHE